MRKERWLKEWWNSEKKLMFYYYISHMADRQFVVGAEDNPHFPALWSSITAVSGVFRKSKFLAIIIPILLLTLTPARSAETPANATDSKEHHDARMEWWREAKFGLFIHWGVYAVPAGVYHAKSVKGAGEWIMSDEKIPMAEYQTYAKSFNPVKYDAEAWVRIAKDAGMKYIVITSKHHDGFALFDSAASDWNVVKTTPYGKDLLQPLVDSCRKYEIKLGFYYSQAQDWNNGGSEMSGKWDKAQDHSMDDYIDKIAVPQVREILTKYGKDVPAVLWWDTPVDMNRERADKIYKVVKEVRPDIIMNNRLGGGYKGDTETPENVIPANGYPGRDWETCMVMNDTWGYKRDDHQWKSTETLLRNLCDIASKGGNYLLNVGPTAKGLVPEASIERLAEIGKWMRVNGDAIYGTGPTIFGAEAGAFSKTEKDRKKRPKFIPAWNWRCTTKPGRVYIHIFKWPSGDFELPAMKQTITRAYLLADKTNALGFKQSASGFRITLPAKAPDAIASVICLEVKP